MSKPANLEYAFPGHGSTAQRHIVAYRVVGTAFVGVCDELDVSLLPDFDYTTTPYDGDGSVGQYVVFTYTDIEGSDQSRVLQAAAFGFDPFDPANHKPTSVRYWELQPGSDVMATTLGVLPKIGVISQTRTYYAGLITVPAADSTPTFAEDGTVWWLLPADSPITSAEVLDAAPSVVWPGDPIEAGPYIALYDSHDGTPPFAFPAGWTPGNTTGSGPVLPKIGTTNGSDYYGGLVLLDEAGTVPVAGGVAGWFLLPADTALTAAAINAGVGIISEGGSTSAGLYLAGYYTDPGNPAPTALPTGWTFRPYGIGPVAITDENAGGVIGDIAYVVSGYVYNTEAFGMQSSRWIGMLPAGTTHIDVGDVFNVPNHSGFPFVATSAGDVVITGGPGSWVVTYENGAEVGVPPDLDYAWPFLERYNLKTKTWLPRVPLPSLAMGLPAWVSGIDYPLSSKVAQVTYAGQVWRRSGSPGDLTVPPPDNDNWTVVDASIPYAAEGGFAGVIDNKLYFGGGDGNYNSGREFFVYDPVTGEFTRLPDVVLDAGQSYTGDYSPYGVVGGKLYVFGHAGDAGSIGNVFDPAVGWSIVPVPPSDILNADQVAGVEIGDKLYFVYDRVYVFDPVALTIEAKAAIPDGAPVDNAVFLALGNSLVGEFRGTDGAHSFAYNVVSDSWSSADYIAPPIIRSGSGGVHNRTLFVFSGIKAFIPGGPGGGVGDNLAGIWGLTGNQPTYTAPGTVKNLQHRGFSTKQAFLLQTGYEDATLKQLLTAGFSLRQAKTLKRGVITMKALLRGGFNRTQAKALVSS